jgi:hypothetical protein
MMKCYIQKILNYVSETSLPPRWWRKCCIPKILSYISESLLTGSPMTEEVLLSKDTELFFKELTYCFPDDRGRATSQRY